MISNLIQVKKPNTLEGERIFSILIPSWNNLKYLQNCIYSIRKNSFFRHQIIVHVNEGNDGTLEWIDKQPDVDYTFSSVNIGICFALNACRKLVDTSYIAYMNDDMYVCPDWDKYLYEEIQTIGHPYFFLSATAIEPFSGNNCCIYRSFGEDLNCFDEEKLLREFEKLDGNDWMGATWPPNVLHTSLWDLVGGYSVEFSPGFYSDPDFSMKLWQAGVRLFKGVHKSRVYHFGSKSTKRIDKGTGYQKFILKWGITSGSFTKYFLQRGELFNGMLPQNVSLSRSIVAKNFMKRFVASYRM
jgi:glycosyltransferase involved in cell wall biosynthesis